MAEQSDDMMSRPVGDGSSSGPSDMDARYARRAWSRRKGAPRKLKLTPDGPDIGKVCEDLREFMVSKPWDEVNDEVDSVIGKHPGSWRLRILGGVREIACMSNTDKGADELRSLIASVDDRDVGPLEDAIADAFLDQLYWAAVEWDDDSVDAFGVQLLGLERALAGRLEKPSLSGKLLDGIEERSGELRGAYSILYDIQSVFLSYLASSSDIGEMAARSERVAAIYSDLGPEEQGMDLVLDSYERLSAGLAEALPEADRAEWSWDRREWVGSMLDAFMTQVREVCDSDPDDALPADVIYERLSNLVSKCASGRP